MSRSTANWLLYVPMVIISILFVRPQFSGGCELIDEIVDLFGLLLALGGISRPVPPTA